MNTTPVPLQPVQTSMPQAQTATTLGTNRAIPRIWESAADGKRVYDYVIQQEGNFVSPDQNMFSYDWSVLRTVPNMINNYMNLKDMKLVDKYKHAYMNCEASQFGKGGSDIASIVSNLREWNDRRTGVNTLDSSEGDQYANKIGRLLGGKYPNGDCDELVQRYINKKY